MGRLKEFYQEQMQEQGRDDNWQQEAEQSEQEQREQDMKDNKESENG